MILPQARNTATIRQLLHFLLPVGFGGLRALSCPAAPSKDSFPPRRLPLAFDAYNRAAMQRHRYLVATCKHAACRAVCIVRPDIGQIVMVKRSHTGFVCQCGICHRRFRCELAELRPEMLPCAAQLRA